MGGGTGKTSLCELQTQNESRGQRHMDTPV